MPFSRGYSSLGTEIVTTPAITPAILEKFQRHVGWETLCAGVAQRRREGEAVGLGLGFFVEKSGLGPLTMFASFSTAMARSRW
jgi:carbon-monoxide dehydrogenase large subunit